ncbi:aspartate ammonia-lyase [Gluconobacter albidus]|uniref:aspartate ammonia-lyase n=1 Tax=Gluconobacter albidus TaxID=318683 RepID=UPI0020A1E3EC|nr:aspartate ammonia-lyase [Gluconobacter albidus]MCP1274670.1 aspartate ammonia-lyase [Gluconobacter albidus]
MTTSASRSDVAADMMPPLDGFRVEKDLLGEACIPKNALWGVHTSRAAENFPISGEPVGAFSDFIRAFVTVKQAAARTNRALGYLDEDRASLIEAACRALLTRDDYCNHFIVDVMQGGAGTSTNMNVNEVIANVALELAGQKPGDYQILHPNDHVNMAQSTNDVYPTALRLGLLTATAPLLEALEELARAFGKKADEFSDILKVGRTQLRDAVPMTLGQEFRAFQHAMETEIRHIRSQCEAFLTVNLGGTAIGTGLNTDPRYADAVIRELGKLTGLAVTGAADRIEATSDVGAFVLFSGVLKRLALKLSKISSDLRLLSSGPRAGIGEITLPSVQAGSSIMPGKVNPVIPEAVNQVAYLVAGYDVTLSMCADGGQFQLNPFEPMIGYCLFSSLKTLTAAIRLLTTKCVSGIAADAEQCRFLFERNIGIVTALVPLLGYDTCSRIARRALAENRSVPELVLQEKLVSQDVLAGLLRPEFLTRPNVGQVEAAFR